MTVWHEIGKHIREVARTEARAASPPVRRATVLVVVPLTVDLGDDEIISVDDEDVEVDRKLLAEPPGVGDVVRVHTDGHGDYLIGGIIDG